MSVPLAELQAWDERIQEWVAKFGLQPYPQEFELCDHHEMIGYMAYAGMPSRYSHWSFGKSFERQKMLYDYGVAGLPYEMVINSNPCLAYLMRDNSRLLQVLTMAHVYGHNDFFANNFTFTSAYNAAYTIESFKNHSQRIDRYIEDPSIGLEAVEQIIDHAHALSLQRSRNLALRELAREEQKLRAWERAQHSEDPYWQIHPRREYTPPDLDKVPLEPTENLLQFIAAYNPYLAEWQKDLLQIVDQESRYFMPQIETKIMNEGWASYWHYQTLNELQLEQGLHLEFLVRHNQVLRPTPGGLNPYHLGFVIWNDIEKRWNEGRTGQEYTPATPPAPSSHPHDSPGRRKIFEVRETDRDSAFLRRFLTREIMQELDLFEHERRGKDRVITRVADEDNWEAIKANLIKNVGSGGIPVIKVQDADFNHSRSMYLKHYHDGRDLQLEYAEQTLKHVTALWGRAVLLETVLNNRKSLLTMKDGSLKIEGI